MLKKYINFKDKSLKIEKWEPQNKEIDKSKLKSIESRALASIREGEINTSNPIVRTKLLLNKINIEFKEKPVTPLVKIINYWLSPISK